MIADNDIKNIKVKLDEKAIRKTTVRRDLYIELMDKLNMIYEEMKATREIMRRTNSLRSHN